MPSETILRPVMLADASAIAAIYAHYVMHTCITFEYVAPTEAEIQQRIQKVTAKYPWLVAITQGELSGYAYATSFRERDAYRWDVETSVYVKETAQRKGIATLLYNELLEMCTRQGFYNAIAGITVPNDKSVAFHKKAGFSDVGVFSNIGFKMGAWHDVLFMEKKLREHDGTPAEIQPPSR